MEKVKTSKGVLKYRNPTIVETIALVRLLRVHFANEDDAGAKLTIMENIKDLLDYSEMKDIKSFEDLNNHGELAGELFKISDVILKKIVGAFAKKA